MEEPSRAETPQSFNPVVPVVLGAVIGVVLVIWWVSDLGAAEIALIFLPMLVGAAVGLAYYRWATRRGDV